MADAKLLLVSSALHGTFLEWLIQPDTEGVLTDVLEGVKLHRNDIASPTPPPRSEAWTAPAESKTPRNTDPPAPVAPLVSPEPPKISVASDDTLPAFYEPPAYLRGFSPTPAEAIAALADAERRLAFCVFEEEVVCKLWRLPKVISHTLWRLVGDCEALPAEQPLDAVLAFADRHRLTSGNNWWNFFSVLRTLSHTTCLGCKNGEELHTCCATDAAWARYCRDPADLAALEDSVVSLLAFRPLVLEFINRHGSVVFLKDFPEFQERLADSIMTRIHYDMAEYRVAANLQTLRRTEQLSYVTYRALCHSCLLQTWLDSYEYQHQPSQLTYANLRRYFNYEQFYVSYFLFFNLDQDSDGLIDKQDFVKYDNYAFSTTVINRIFGQSLNLLSPALVSHMAQDGVKAPYEGVVEGTMNHQAFFIFLMNDQDKTSDRSIEYWFNIVDINGDGVINKYEINNFYSDQLARLNSRQLDAPPLEVVYSQVNDMIQPERPSQITLRDLKRQRRHAPHFFNTLVNMTKYWAWEQRDPFATRTEILEYPLYTELERWARLEYDRIIAMESANSQPVTATVSHTEY